jgi:AcrR family transcriptional regulator
MTDQKRPYRKRRRAELEQETRRRITESAVALHGTLGPVQTSMSAIAEHAGVRRSTLYRHFVDEDSLFMACSAHWIADNPVPDLGGWAAIRDPDERLEFSLNELYAFYERTERMMGNVLRDEGLVPIVRELLDGFRGFLDAARELLMEGRRRRGAARTRLQAALGHAVAFHTWRSLVREQGLGNAQAAEMMCQFVAAVR